MSDMLAITITSAQELSAAQLKKLESGIAKAHPEKSLQITTHVDPQLIGGLIVRVAGKEYDASVAGKLHSVSRQLRSFE